jgi:hypothetical protein
MFVKMTANVGECLKNLTRGALKNNPLNYSLKLLQGQDCPIGVENPHKFGMCR